MIPTGILLNILRTASRWGTSTKLDRFEPSKLLFPQICHVLYDVYAIPYYTLHLFSGFLPSLYWYRLTLHNHHVRCYAITKPQLLPFFSSITCALPFPFAHSSYVTRSCAARFTFAPPPKRNITSYHIDLGIQLR